jgi:phosphate starvation-inducible PhoH-like protein
MATNSGKKARRKSPTCTNNGDTYSDFKEVKPLNYIQQTYLEAIFNNDITFGIGSAGTGKTYVAAAYAAEQLFHRKIDKILLTRPNIEVGKSLGYLPGTLEEKYLPYLEPFDSVFIKTLGRGFYEYAIKNKAIEPKPLGFMRGLTFDNCVVLVDEVQNMTKTEFKMLLSRIGRNCKVILSGDDNQLDVKDSGLDDALYRLQNVEGVEIIRFLDNDIVRSKICKEIILAYKD